MSTTTEEPKSFSSCDKEFYDAFNGKHCIGKEDFVDYTKQKLSTCTDNTAKAQLFSHLGQCWKP